MTATPKMDVYGLPIEPFLPELEWIEKTIKPFFRERNALPAGSFSFSLTAHVPYYSQLHGFNFGVTPGVMVGQMATKFGWPFREEVVDSARVVTCEVDQYVKFGQRSTRIQETDCKVMCVEPWITVPDGESRFGAGFSKFNFYIAWIGKRNQSRVVYDHAQTAWLG